MCAMEKILPIMLIICADVLVNAKPIHRGFTVKLNPILLREYIIPKTFGSLFKKIPHEVSQEAIRQDFVTEFNSTNFFNCTEDAVKVLYPRKRVEVTDEIETYENFNIPIIRQPFRDYNIIVAAAPWHVRFSGDETNPSVIYIVFPGDDGDAKSKSINIPAIYFVRKADGLSDVTARLKGGKIDPEIIVDSNRTVTGLKSKEVPKYVKFKSKLLKGIESFNKSDMKI